MVVFYSNITGLYNLPAQLQAEHLRSLSDLYSPHSTIQFDNYY